MGDYEETQSNKLSRKIEENPFMPVGICGLIMACGYGAYMFKRRGEMSVSMYLMQLRVAAQGTIVGILTLGVAYNMVKQYVLNKDQSVKKIK